MTPMRDRLSAAADDLGIGDAGIEATFDANVRSALRRTTSEEFLREIGRHVCETKGSNDYPMDEIPLHAVFPPGRRLSTRVRSFVDFLVQRFSDWEA